MNTRLAISILKIGIAGTFLGHGVFGLMGKEGWIKYYSVIGITNPETALTLIKFVGFMDVVIAIIILVKPYRIVVIWSAIWALVAALAKFNAGAPIWDFIERFSYWAALLALLALQGFPKNARDLFKL